VVAFGILLSALIMARQETQRQKDERMALHSTWRFQPCKFRIPETYPLRPTGRSGARMV